MNRVFVRNIFENNHRATLLRQQSHARSQWKAREKSRKPIESNFGFYFERDWLVRNQLRSDWFTLALQVFFLSQSPSSKELIVF